MNGKSLLWAETATRAVHKVIHALGRASAGIMHSGMTVASSLYVILAVTKTLNVVKYD